jgi:predicted nucleic acid-binding protein
MAVLVDTCVLIPLLNPQAELHGVVRSAVRRLRAGGETLIVTPQIFAELWNVSTRPFQYNGRGLDPATVAKMIGFVSRVCDLRFETSQSLEIWLDLVQRLEVIGVAVHDARLVSVMLHHGIPQILTCNIDDFSRYTAEKVEVLTPSDVAAA